MRRFPRLAVVALLTLPLFGLACGSDDASDALPTESGHVKVVDNEFEPKTIEASPGDTITWDFEGDTQHNVIGSGFKSKNRKSGTFEHQFNSAGEYDYVCTIHPGMTGSVKVG